MMLTVRHQPTLHAWFLSTRPHSTASRAGVLAVVFSAASSPSSSALV
jgi:hypothetical protein